MKRAGCFVVNSAASGHLAVRVDKGGSALRLWF